MSKHKHKFDPNKHFLEASRENPTTLQCQASKDDGGVCYAKITLGDCISLQTAKSNRHLVLITIIATSIALFSPFFNQIRQDDVVSVKIDESQLSEITSSLNSISLQLDDTDAIQKYLNSKKWESINIE